MKYNRILLYKVRVCFNIEKIKCQLTQVHSHTTDVFWKFFVYSRCWWFIDTYMSDLRLKVFSLSIQPTVFLQKLLFRSIFHIWKYKGGHILWRQISLSPHHRLNSFFSNKMREIERDERGLKLPWFILKSETTQYTTNLFSFFHSGMSRYK